MADDPVRIADTRAWFTKSDNDLRTIAAVLEVKRPILDVAMFHCQQAIEKALKGFLAWHDQPFPRTHELSQLAGICVEIDGSLELLAHQIAPLSKYAVASRYPGEVPEVTKTEARKAFELARELVAAILDRLPTEVRPQVASPPAAEEK